MTPTTRRARLVLTLGPSDPTTDPCLDAIARFAGRSQRRLVATYVDSSALLAAANLPFTRTVGRFGDIRALEPGSTMRAVGARRLRWRQHIEQLAAVHDIQCVFEESRQPTTDELTEDDILSGVASSEAHWSDYRGRPMVTWIQPNGHGIVLAYSGNRRSLELTKELAIDLALPIDVALFCDSQQQAVVCRQDIEEWQDDFPSRGQTRPITLIGSAPLADIVRIQRPRIIIVDHLSLMNDTGKSNA